MQQDNNYTKRKITLLNRINTMDYLNVIVKNRWMILRNFLITIVITVIICFILPRKYTAETTLMPPQEKEDFSMSNILSEVSVPGLPLSKRKSPSETMLEILKSRSVNEIVLKQNFISNNDTLPLFNILGFISIEKGLKEINNITSYFLSEQGFIKISVELGDKQLAADVANAYVEALNKVNREKSVSRAKNSRLYIEDQLNKTEKELNKAAKKLAKFKEDKKAVSLEAQTKMSIEQAAQLKGKIIAKEVQISVMRKTMKTKHPLVIQAKQELQEIENRYKELQYGNISSDGEFYIPFTEVPEVGLRLAELIREVKIKETVWKLLNSQYYQAKIEEARNTPTVQVLDKAVPPIYPSSPKRKVLVIVFGLLSIFFCIFWIFGKEYFNHLEKDEHNRQILNNIQNEFRKDLKTLKNKIKIIKK